MVIDICTIGQGLSIIGKWGVLTIYDSHFATELLRLWTLHQCML